MPVVIQSTRAELLLISKNAPPSISCIGGAGCRDADWLAACREVQARESNKGELLTVAETHKNDLDQHNTDIDALTAELSKADQIAAEREREFITAKDAAAALSARLAEAKYAFPHDVPLYCVLCLSHSQGLLTVF